MEEKERKEESKEEGRSKEERKEERGGRRRRQGERETEERAEKGRSTFVQVTHYWAGLLFILEQKEKKNKSTTDVPRIIFPISSLKINFVF